jgi:hypothetical protein
MCTSVHKIVTNSRAYVAKSFITVFEFIGQLFFQNDVIKLQEAFSEHGIRVFIENGFGSF